MNFISRIIKSILDTIFSNVDTTNNTVTYGICPFQWRQLPCRGLILLNINHTATGATEGSLVSVATSVSSSQVSSNPTSVNTNRCLWEDSQNHQCHLCLMYQLQ